MVVLFPLATAAAVQTNNLPLLTNAAQIHQLAPAEAALGFPVRLRGVITYYNLSHRELFLQDDSGGIFIRVYRTYGFEYGIGQLVEVEGWSAPGDFAPIILLDRVRLLKQSRLPPPRVVTYEQIATGREDCEWIEFSGIVRSVAPGTGPNVHRLNLEIVGGGRVKTFLKEYDMEKCAKLVDAEVSVRGVCFSFFNEKRQLLQVGVRVTRMDDITILKPAPEDPFQARVHPVSSLQQFAPLEDQRHRVKVRGVVTLQRKGQFLFIVDETQGLCIQTAQTTAVEPGDLIEALGFPGAGEYTPVLQDAIFRKIGNEPPPIPVKTTAAECVKGDSDAGLVQFEAQLLNRTQRLHDQILELQAGDLIINAQLDESVTGDAQFASIPNHSRVSLTGICRVHVDQNRLPESFSLLLRSASDVTLIARPSWWTTQHALWILEAALVVSVALLAWVAALRNRVKVQTKIISQKLKREVALEERARIAQDIHDDLGADLTHIAFLSEVAQEEEEELPNAAKKHFQAISGSAQKAIRALDEIVWVVNPKNDTLDHLASYICDFAEDFFRGSSTRCRLDLPPHLPDLPISTKIRNNLFYAAKEALNNIGKYAKASEVVIRIRVEAAVFTITIEDNGRGFDPRRVKPNGNGLLNMRQRLEKIGGRFDLESRQTAGARIQLTLNLPAETETTQISA